MPCLLMIVPAPAEAQGKAAGLRGNPAQFFGPDAYPEEAIALRQEGRVVARLALDSTGRVSSCAVSQSSGSPSLDQRTCDIALEKVVFQPALDRKGRPTAATYTLPVRWVMPQGPIDVTVDAIPPVMSAQATISVDSAGVVQACAMKKDPPDAVMRDPCMGSPVGSQSEFRWVRSGRPVGGSITYSLRMETKIDP